VILSDTQNHKVTPGTTQSLTKGVGVIGEIRKVEGMAETVKATKNRINTSSSCIEKLYPAYRSASIRVFRMRNC